MIESGYVMGVRALDFGSLRRTELILDTPLTVLYGVNGAGKSTILQALTTGITGIAPQGREMWYSEIDIIVADQMVVFKTQSGWRQWHTGLSAGTGSSRNADLLEQTWEQIRREGVGVQRLVGLKRETGVGLNPGPGTPARLVAVMERELRLLLAQEPRDPQSVVAAYVAWSGCRRADAPPVDQCFDELESMAQSSLIFEEFPEEGGLPCRVNAVVDNVGDAPFYGISLVTDPEDDADMMRQMLQFAEEISPSSPGLDEGTMFWHEDGWVQYGPDEMDGLSEPEGTLRRMTPARHQRENERFDDLLEGFQNVTRIANGILQRMLLGAPSLRLRWPSTAADQILGRGVRWGALAEQSAAETRWSRIAPILAGLACIGAPVNYIPSPDGMYFPQGTLLVLDEPERGLHPKAQEHLARGLEWLSQQTDIKIVVATHSPALMNSPLAQVLHVAREGDDGSTTTRPLGIIARDELDYLGLQPSDLLARYRILMLVEGQHDLIMMKALLPRIMAETDWAQIEIIPLHGATKLEAAVDSRLLFDYTSAIVVPVLDNIDPDLVKNTWETAQTIAAVDGPGRAKDYILRQLPGKRAEYVYLRNHLTRALEVGLQSRVAPYSVAKADITEYLNVHEFVPKADSWESLRQQFDDQRASGATKMTNFKGWLSKVHSADFSEDNVAALTNQRDDVPDDFARLAAHLEAVLKAAKK